MLSTHIIIQDQIKLWVWEIFLVNSRNHENLLQKEIYEGKEHWDKEFTLSWVLVIQNSSRSIAACPLKSVRVFWGYFENSGKKEGRNNRKINCIDICLEHKLEQLSGKLCDIKGVKRHKFLFLSLWYILVKHIWIQKYD